jgi:hypothetical protein
MQRETNIYLLRDPRSGEVRYVGKTVRPIEERLRGHILDSKRSEIRTARWIRSLAELGLRPIAELIEVALDDWQAREKYWIAFYRASAPDRLTNHTDGGEGAAGFIPTEETRAKMSAINKARYASEEERRLTGEHVRRALADPEWRKSQSDRQKALWADPEERAVRIAAQRSAAANPEVRLRKSEAAKRSWTPERAAAESESRRQRALKQWSDPERRRAHSERLKEVCSTDAAKQRLAESREACQSAEAAAKRIAWWTPERRAEKGAKMREAKARKSKNASQTDQVGV